MPAPFFMVGRFNLLDRGLIPMDFIALKNGQGHSKKSNSRLQSQKHDLQFDPNDNGELTYLLLENACQHTKFITNKY